MEIHEARKQIPTLRTLFSVRKEKVNFGSKEARIRDH
jgi:hypothetical protein